MAANKFGGKCIKCNTWVEEFDGLLVHKDDNDGRWGVTHVEGFCKTPAPVVADAAPTVTVPDGHYALDGNPVKFYEVRTETRENSNWKGFTFLDACGSDERYPIKNRDEKARILAEIAADIQGAAQRYGHLIGKCSFCARSLTTEESRTAGYGPECAKKHNLPWG